MYLQTAIKMTSAALGAVAIAWALVAFVMWEADPARWSQFARLFGALGAAWGVFFAALFIAITSPSRR